MKGSHTDEVLTAFIDYCYFQDVHCVSNTFRSQVYIKPKPPHTTSRDLDADRWHLGISVTGLFVFAASVKPRTRSATSGPEDHLVLGRALRFELLIAKLCCLAGAVSLCRVRRVCLSRIT